MSGLLGALQFLTRVPIRRPASPDLARSVPWFPIAGGMIGAAVGGIAAGMGELVPMSVAAAIAVVGGMLLTGAFHEDGLADMADALGGWSPAERLEILKDSRHGTYGVAALCSTIVLRILCVASLAPAAAFAGLVAAHVLARAAAVATMTTFRLATADGIGERAAVGLSRTAAALGVTAGVVIVAAASGWWVGPLAAAGVAAVLAVGALAVRALGGITGDVLGAVEQVAECLVLVTVTALATRHQLWWR